MNKIFENPQKIESRDYSYLHDFEYKHRNPYHQRLEEFNSFVLRDREGEECRGKWNSLVFSREAPICLEIGTGFGHFMQAFCKKNPEYNFIGLDYRFKRSFQLAKKLQSLEEKIFFRYLRAKGERIEFLFGDNEISKLFYFFPDPWPKSRQQKKRLFRQQFLNSVYKILRPGGEIYIKTDHDGLYAWMKEFIINDKRFEILLDTIDLQSCYPQHFLSQEKTKFEKIFLEQGVKINAIVLKSLKVYTKSIN